MLVEAVVRLIDGDSSVEAGPMLVVAIAGLGVNLVVFFMLRDGAQDSLAVRGAYVDAMADAAGSVGVIVAAIVIATTGWDPIDPIVAAVIGVWILPRAWRLGRERAPGAAAGRARARRPRRDPRRAHGAARRRRRARPPRVDAHVGDGRRQRARDGRPRRRRARRARPGAVLLLEHEIAHATIQVEPDDHAGCAELNW